MQAPQCTCGAQRQLGGAGSLLPACCFCWGNSDNQEWQGPPPPAITPGILPSFFNQPEWLLSDHWNSIGQYGCYILHNGDPDSSPGNGNVPSPRDALPSPRVFDSTLPQTMPIIQRVIQVPFPPKASIYALEFHNCPFPPYVCAPISHNPKIRPQLQQEQRKISPLRGPSWTGPAILLQVGCRKSCRHVSQAPAVHNCGL